MVLGSGALVLGLWALYHVINGQSRATGRLSLVLVGTICGTLVTSLQQFGVFSTMTISWTDPTKSILEAMMLLNFDVELLRLSCVVHMSPALTYLVKMASAFWVLVVILIIHIL